MATTLSTAHVSSILGALPSPSTTAQPGHELRAHELAPVHVLYGGAHLYRAETPDKLARLARAAMETWGADDAAFGRAVGVDADDALASAVATRVRRKLERAAVEAVCIDFEDGYGPRPDDEEDAEAVRTGAELARATREVAADATRVVVGIRIKALAGASATRAVRTLDRFVTSFVGAAGPRLPGGFTVTLPKVTHPAEVRALATLLDALETELGLPSGGIGIELMVEAPRALVDAEGRAALPALVAAAGGRCVAAHLGAYDLTASLGVAATEQRMDHPACDAARLVMQLTLAERNVAVYDGATTILPIAPHSKPASESERQANVDAVHCAWALHARNVRRALAFGIHRGWDLHPAQLPARYGALFASLLAERASMTARLGHFVERATQATRSGQVFDDAATGQGLVNFFLRGVACGALDDTDLQATGLTLDELRSRSFADIVATRAGGGARASG